MEKLKGTGCLKCCAQLWLRTGEVPIYSLRLTKPEQHGIGGGLPYGTASILSSFFSFTHAEGTKRLRSLLLAPSSTAQLGQQVGKAENEVFFRTSC